MRFRSTTSVDQSSAGTSIAVRSADARPDIERLKIEYIKRVKYIQKG